MYFKGQCNPVSDEFRPKKRLFYESMRVSDVRWNFEVFLINKRGYPAYRFSVGTSMQDFATAIRELLDEPIL